MRKLRRNHKNLMIIEAGYIYCKRHNLVNETFIDNVFLSEEFDCSEGSEFDNICKDLLNYRYLDNYDLIEISIDEYEICVDEYEICVDEFGEDKKIKHTISSSLVAEIKMLLEQYRDEEMPNWNMPFHNEAEGWSAIKWFIVWLERNKKL